MTENTTIHATRWTSKTIYVDIDTGQQLTANDARNKYNWIIIFTKKQTTFNEHKTHATIEYTKLCRRNPQKKLPFN